MTNYISKNEKIFIAGSSGMAGNAIVRSLKMAGYGDKNNECPYKFNRIDFLNIDLEGQEYEVLRDFDFKKYKIDLISVEMLSHNILSKKTSIKLNKLLVRNKFKFIYKTGVNFFYKNTKWNYQ